MNREDLDKIFEEAFSKEELGLFAEITPIDIDVEALRKTGYVSVETFEERGLVQTAVTYNSFDGKTNFTKTSSIYKIEEDYMNNLVLNERIKSAVAEEDYETAAELKKEKNELLNKKRKEKK